MSKPFLLVETPRAGDMNHRFICSPGADVTGEVASDLCGRVRLAAGETRDRVVGDDYVAVIKRGVFQVRSDRRGDEIMLLGGIDPGRVDVNAAAKLMAARMPALGDIAAEIANQSGMLVEHSALRPWLDEALLARSPEFTGTGSGVPWKKVAVIATILVAVAAVALASPYLSSLFAGKGDGGQPGSQPGAGNPPAKKATLDDLAKALRLSDADRAELTRRVPADSPAIPKLLEQVEKNAVDPYFLLRDAGGKGDWSGLTDLAPADKTLTPQQAIELRTTLRAWRFHLAAIRDAVRAVHATALGAKEPGGKQPAPVPPGPTRSVPPAPKSPPPTPTFDLLTELAKWPNIDDETTGPNPAVPWFDKADVDTARAMRNVFIVSPIGEKFAAARLTVKPTDRGNLAAFLGALHDRATEVGSALKRETTDLGRYEKYALAVEKFRDLTDHLWNQTDGLKRPGPARP